MPEKYEVGQPRKSRNGAIGRGVGHRVGQVTAKQRVVEGIDEWVGQGNRA